MMVLMGNKRTEIAMSDDEVQEFLHTGGNIQIALYGPDGYPDITPMWYVVDGDRLWMRTYGRVRRCSMPGVIRAVAPCWRRGPIPGTARCRSGDLELTDDLDRICWVAARLMVKYEGVDPAHIPALETAYRGEGPKQVAMSLSLARIVSWGPPEVGRAVIYPRSWRASSWPAHGWRSWSAPGCSGVGGGSADAGVHDGAAGHLGTGMPSPVSTGISTT